MQLIHVGIKAIDCKWFIEHLNSEEFKYEVVYFSPITFLKHPLLNHVFFCILSNNLGRFDVLSHFQILKSPVLSGLCWNFSLTSNFVLHKIAAQPARPQREVFVLAVKGAPPLSSSFLLCF